MVTIRKAHYLSGNSGMGKPTRHLFFDVETEPIDLGSGETEHRLKLGWAMFWRRRAERGKDTVRFRSFRTADEFWGIVQESTHKREPLYLVCHNVAYDWGVLSGFLEMGKRGWTIRSFYASGVTVIVTLGKGDYKIRLVDNMNFYKCPLAVLGDVLGFPKSSVDFRTVSLADLSDYCKRDVEIMQRGWAAFYAFMAEHELGHWGFTLPAQAFNAYRHRFMHHDLLVHGEAEVLALEREAYHGGRTSVFRVGRLTEGPFHKVDVNSMYPYVMSTCPMPVKLLDVFENVPLRELGRMVEKYCVVARVTVRTTEPVYSTRQGLHNVYPVGEFVTVLSTPEIVYGLTQGQIVRTWFVAKYSADIIFREYVEYFYGLKDRYRREGNGVFYQLTKLYLNGLYGKFGQRKSKWSRIDDPGPMLDGVDIYLDPATGKQITIHRLGSEIWQCEDDGEANESIPAIAAHVTARARVYLWELCKTAGHGHYVYTDTDSIIVDGEGLRNLESFIDPGELGKLKVEDSAETVTILAPKEYEFSGHWTRKGVPRKAEQVGESTWKFTQFPSLLGQSHWTPEVPYHVTETSRTLSHTITDGTPDTEGWIIPVHVGEHV